jgi:hypothetical protein
MNSRQGYPAGVLPYDRRTTAKNRCYFDESVEQLLNQARKYKVGLVLARSTSGSTLPRGRRMH